MDSQKLIEIEQQGKTVEVVFLFEYLFARTDLDRIFGEINQMIRDQPHLHLILNFRRVNNISSVFIGELMALNQKIRKSNAKLDLIEVNEQVFEIFALTRIENHLPIRKSSDRSNPVSRLVAKARQPDTRPMVALMATGSVALVLMVIFLSQLCLAPDQFFKQSLISQGASLSFVFFLPAIFLGWRLKKTLLKLSLSTQWCLTAATMALMAMLLVMTWAL